MSEWIQDNESKGNSCITMQGTLKVSRMNKKKLSKRNKKKIVRN